MYRWSSSPACLRQDVHLHLRPVQVSRPPHLKKSFLHTLLLVSIRARKSLTRLDQRGYYFKYFFSTDFILSTRGVWRPPANSVVSQVLTICFARLTPIKPAPSVNTFVSLCSRLFTAEE